MDFELVKGNGCERDQRKAVEVARSFYD